MSLATPSTSADVMKPVSGAKNPYANPTHSVAIWPRTGTAVRPLMALAPSPGSRTRSVNGPPCGAKALSTPVAAICPPFPGTLPRPGDFGQIRSWGARPPVCLSGCVLADRLFGHEFRREGQESADQRREVLSLAVQDVDGPLDDESV